MKKTLILAAAAIAALSACTKENNEAPEVAKAPVFTATIEPETKTQLVEGSTAGKLTKVAWLNTDQVFIYGMANNGSINIVSVVGNYNVSPDAEDATSATLTPGSSLKFNRPEVPTTYVAAIYPASFSRINVENIDIASQLMTNGAPKLSLTQKAYDFVLPATQKYNGTDISQIAPMYGVNNEEGKIEFANVTALLAITVPATECSSVKEIVVSSDKQMNGTYVWNTSTGNFEPRTSTTESGDGTKSLTLDCTDKYGSGTNITSGQSKTFYVSIPPQTYGYLKIDINKDGANHFVMQTKDGAEINVERNNIYPITFAPTSTYGYDETEDEL